MEVNKMFHNKYPYQISVDNVMGGNANYDMDTNDPDSLQTKGANKAGGANDYNDVNGTQGNKADPKSDSPELEQARSAASYDLASGAIASFGASVIALIYSEMHETAKAHRAQTLQQGMLQAELTDQQAVKIMEEAKDKLVGAVLSGVVSMLGSVVSLGVTGKGIQVGQDKMQSYNNIAMSINQIAGSVGQISNAVGEFSATTHSAEAKHLEADSQRIDALKSQLQSITDSVQQQASKILDSYQQMAQSQRDALLAVLR